MKENNTTYNDKINKQISLQDNLERSFVGEKWFAYGETKDNYILIYHKVVSVIGENVFIEHYTENEKIFDGFSCCTKEQFIKDYPIQKDFPYPMSIDEAKKILVDKFF